MYRLGAASGQFSVSNFKYPRGAEIFGEAELAEYIYQVIEGAVRTHKLLPDGRRQIGAFHFRGDIFGLENSETHRFTAEALVPTTVRLAKRESVEEVARNDPAILHTMLAMITNSLTHVENHITWAPNHQAIQFVTDFNGKPHYNGFYAYDPAKKSINFYYTSESGQLTIGTSTPDADGKTLRQEFDVTQPSGVTNRIRSTVARDGNNAYVFTVFEPENGEWKQLLQIIYKRKM